jgi:hypothetical protein
MGAVISRTKASPPSELAVWQLDQWKNPDVGPQLLEHFRNLGYDDKTLMISFALRARPDKRLAALIEATGNTVRSSDINYVWTSSGRMAILLDDKQSCKDQPPLVGLFYAEALTFDEALRAWVVDLGLVHAQVIRNLEREAASATTEEAARIAEELLEFAAENMCENGDWANGIALVPFPKFALVTKCLKTYCPDLHAAANKMIFYKAPETTKPPFLQLKVHRTCFFFKGRNGPGSVLVNPEFAKHGQNILRENLPSSVYDELQLTIEIIGGRHVSGKLTIVDDKLLAIPMAPPMVNNFDPHAVDVESDFNNAFVAFRNSHVPIGTELEPPETKPVESMGPSLKQSFNFGLRVISSC